MNKLVLALSIFFLGITFSNNAFSQGCVETTSDDGPQIVGYIQPQFNSYFFDDDANGNAVKPSSFLFQRARIGILGSIPYDISYYVMAELSPVAGGPMLLDAFVSYAPLGKYFKVSMGQFKSPFGLEVNTPCFALHTIERSVVTNQLSTPLRELGIMFLGSFGKERDIVSYKLAILNGTGINHLDDNNNKDIAARVAVAPIDWITVGASYRSGFVGLINSSGDQKKRTRYAADISVEKMNFRLQGEYVWGEDQGLMAVTGGGCGKSTLALDNYKKNGFWAHIMYMTPWGIEPVIKYEVYNPNGTEYKYMDVTQDFGQSTWTFGVNYFLNDWTRLQLNYLYNVEETVGTQVNEFANDALYIQIQAKF
jgi:phosphate-selective porin